MTKIAAIICEYNPFHAGHAYQIARVRALYPDAAVVSIMSGSFVQRAQSAAADKYVRARSAVTAGAEGPDLVLELPFPWSCASAEYFARAGVYIASAIGADALCFGSETGDIDTLKRACAVVASDAFTSEFAFASADGKGAAAAREAAMAAINPDFVPIMRAPNDILALEYLRALDRVADAARAAAAEIDAMAEAEKEEQSRFDEAAEGFAARLGSVARRVADARAALGARFGGDRGDTSSDGTSDDDAHPDDAALYDPAPQYDAALTIKAPEPVAIPRIRGEGIESASTLRSLMHAGGEWERYMPSATAGVYNDAMARSLAPASLDRIGDAVLLSLRLSAPDAIDAVADAHGGLGRRLIAAALASSTLADALAAAATKRYTNARLRRVALYNLIGVTKAQLCENPAYTIVLAANERGRACLRSLKPALPVVTKPADIALCGEEAQRQFALSTRADAVFTLCTPSPTDAGRLVRSSPVMI